MTVIWTHFNVSLSYFWKKFPNSLNFFFIKTYSFFSEPQQVIVSYCNISHWNVFLMWIKSNDWQKAINQKSLNYTYRIKLGNHKMFINIYRFSLPITYYLYISNLQKSSTSAAPSFAKYSWLCALLPTVLQETLVTNATHHFQE